MKITSEDFTDVTLAIDDTLGDNAMLEVVIGVMVMEVDKVANEVPGMEFV